MISSFFKRSSRQNPLPVLLFFKAFLYLIFELFDNFKKEDKKITSLKDLPKDLPPLSSLGFEIRFLN